MDQNAMFNHPLSDPFFGFFDSLVASKVAKVLFRCCGFGKYSPEVRNFMRLDLPLWHDLVHVKDFSLNPTLVFQDAEGKPIFDLDVAHMTRQEINKILKNSGLKKVFYMFGGRPTIIPREDEEEF